MWRNVLTPITVSLLMIAATVFVPMTIVIKLSDRDAISLGQGIAIFATFITGGLIIAAGIWFSWFLAR